MNLTIIIPAYNEEKRIGPTLEHFAKEFSKAEILVVINGCEDDTKSVVENYEKKFDNIKHLEYGKIGKGGAIIKGFENAKGKYLCFIDADSSTEPDQVKKLYEEIQNSNYAGIIGSRWIKGAEIKQYQPLPRIIASRVYNLLVRIVLGLDFKDTQCGAKIFKQEAIMKVINDIAPTTWEFDVALLYALKKKNLLVKEMPIVWEDKLGSQLKIHKTAPKMFKSLIMIKRHK